MWKRSIATSTLNVNSNSFPGPLIIGTFEGQKQKKKVPLSVSALTSFFRDQFKHELHPHWSPLGVKF